MVRRSKQLLQAVAATALAGGLALLSLAACSVQSEGSASNQAGQGVVTASTDRGVVVPGPADPGGAGGNAAGLPGWVPPGPADPADPPPDGWYAPLVAKDCQSMPGVDTSGDGGAITLVTAAFDVCIAVTTNSADAWDAASAAVESLTVPSGSGCLETATFAVLGKVLAYHLAHAGTPVETVPGTGTACPLGLTGVTEQNGDPSAVNPQVPAPGGTELRLMGRFLAVTSVLVNGLSVPVSRLAENHFDFTAPPAAVPGPVTVTAVGPDGAALPGSATFTYLASAGQPSTSSDASAEPTTPDTMGTP